MDELILRILSGDATSSEEERVRRWRAASPGNEAYFRDLAAVWSATAPVPGEEPAAPADPARVIAEADRRRTGGAADVLPLPRRRIGIARGFAIAAGLAAVAVTVRLVASRAPAGSAASYAAAAEETRTVALDDGSFVRLAGGSAIEAEVTGNVREVRLSGRAFFAVAHDPARPFVVHTADTETRVLGTRFEVAEIDGGVRTVVVDGRVELANAEGAVEAGAGDVARADPDRAPSTTHPADARTLLDWPGGLLLFQGTPLARVAEEVERTFGRTVTVETDALRALRISGSFQDEGFEEVVQGLCDTSGAACRIDAGGAVISPAAAPARR